MYFFSFDATILVNKDVYIQPLIVRITRMKALPCWAIMLILKISNRP